jgi:glycosyltransferase involved in cell wall biosynthesis
LADYPARKVSIIAPDLIGGGMTRAYVLAQAIAYAGYDVEIFGVKLTKGPLYPIPPSSIRVREVNGRSRLYCLLKLAIMLDGDILYAIKPRLSSYGIALLKRAVTRSHVVLDIDDWQTAELNQRGTDQSTADGRQSSSRTGIDGRLKTWARVWLRRCLAWPNPAEARYVRWMQMMIDRADAITVNTRFLQNLYGGTYVPQCKDAGKYDPDKYSPEDSRRRYGLSGYKVLMFSGTARPHKGLEDILSAMSLLGNPDLRLVIVGGRHHGEKYVTHLVTRWACWIVRLPAFPQDQVPEVLAAAHAIVVPQRDTAIARAQFPNKLTDGMAMGKPIITTAVGDIPEIVGDSGYVVEPSSPEQLAEAITAVLEDPQEAANRGRRARERFVRHFSLGAVGPVLSGVLAPLDPAANGA